MKFTVCLQLVVTLILALAWNSAFARSMGPQQALNRVLDGHEVEVIHKLPTTGGLLAVKADNKLYIMSANGRFLFSGTLRDLWHGGQVLSSMADIERYALRLDLDALGLDFSRLITAYLGHGQKQVTVFVAPNCPSCTRVLQQLESMGDQYTTRVVVVPKTAPYGPARRIDCASDQQKKQALLLGQSSPEVKPDKAPTCAGFKGRLLATQMAARVIGVMRVPFIIAPDGRVSQGLARHQTLTEFLTTTEASP